MPDFKPEFHRGTGLLVIEVNLANPNGDPDMESFPRMMGDGRGLISPVSFKRKLRDLLIPDPSVDDAQQVGEPHGLVWSQAQEQMSELKAERAEANEYFILEARGRDRKSIESLSAADFIKQYWDARIFGNTFLEKKDRGEGGDEKKTKKSGQETENQETANKDHFISSGVVQFGPGVSISPVEIETMTWTNKSGVQEGKDRGMAPMGWKAVRHGVYVMPYFVNPIAAHKTKCTALDVKLLKFLIPYAYKATASVIRQGIEIRHAWYAEHQSPLGSCPDWQILEALAPKRADDSQLHLSSKLWSDYEVPTDLPAELKERVKLEDLCSQTDPRA